MSGPHTVRSSEAGPTGTIAVAPASRSASSSNTVPGAITRDAAEHFWPAYPNALFMIAGTATSRSASLSTTIGFLPPISAITRFTWRWPGRTIAARSMMCRPTAFDPVNTTNATVGCSTRYAPTSSPMPGRNASTPGGTPASCRISTRRSAMPGVCSAGLKSTALPVTSAAVTMPAGIASGKFHGEITTPTPRGS